jgi:hypothetical protein
MDKIDFNTKESKTLIHFLEVERCLKFTADRHFTDIFTIINILEKGQYVGIKNWYRRSAEKWWKPQTPKFIEIKERSLIEEMINYLPVIITGARPGEIIIGTKTQSTNAMLKIYDSIVPPKTQALDNIRGFNDLWEIFLTKLGTIDYFNNLTKLERIMWLEYYQSDYDLYLEDVEGLKVEILSFGSSDFLKLNEQTLEILGEQNVKFDMKDITEMFPKKPGSDGLKGRHTLVFRRGIWKVSTIYREVKNFEGPTINIINGEYSKSLNTIGNGGNSDDIIDTVAITFDSFAKKYLYVRGKNTVLEKQSIAIIFNKETNFTLNYINLLDIIGDFKNEFTLIKKATRNFTAASYKSLLQKTIRFRPISVEISEGNIINGDFFLKCVIILLFMNPGSFVPDIQRYVSGVESAFKRVVVTLFEDSFIFPEDEKKVLSVITGAFLAQRLPGWKTNKTLINKTLEVASIGYNSSNAFIYNTRRVENSEFQPYVLHSESKPLEITSCIMDELRSFKSDLIMIRDITEKRYSDNKEEITNIFIRPNIMPLCHCVDQHWAPEIVYMYPLEIVLKLKTEGNKPFSGLFIKLFSEVTGVNPRRPLRKGKVMEPTGYVVDFEDQEFIKITRNAQNLVLFAKQNDSIDIEYIHDVHYECMNRKSECTKNLFYELEYELDYGWISGMLGTIEVKGNPTALVTLHPSDPSVFIAVRKPSRDMKDPFLSDKREAEVINEVKKRLISGIPLNQTKPPIPELKGKKLVYNESEIDPKFYIVSNVFSAAKSSAVKKEWDEIRKGVILIPYIKDISYNIEHSLKYGGEGIVKNPFIKLNKILDETSNSFIQKTLTYIGVYTSEFEFKRIGREGGGTDGVVSIEDVGAFHLILKIKLIFPSAFKRAQNSALKYIVNVGPLLWKIKEHIITYLSKNNNEIDQSLWGNTGEKIGRELWDHQLQSLSELQNAHKLGRKGHFIWIPVGLGKTVLVLSYLKWLQSTNSLTKYVIYTLPSSAIDSIIQEIESYGFTYVLLVPLKNLGGMYKTKKEGKVLSSPSTSTSLKYNIVKGCKPVSYSINLIEHDHLRKCDEVLCEYMKDSIFIIDEVHKALNETKRTAVALQLSHLAKEFVAMTGTPIIDTHTYKLIWWLEQIVPFEVNEQNFWVAANGMIAKRVDTGVMVNRKDIYIPMTPEQENTYYNLVSEGLGGRNSHPTSQDLMKAMRLCYKIANIGIINEIQKTLDGGNTNGITTGVFVVAENVSHQLELKSQILNSIIIKGRKSKLLKDEEIFLIRNGKSIFLTDKSVKDGLYPDYKIVITTIRKVEGYTLTRFNTMITSVYPSNNANREQLEGRINRICQKSDTVYYKIIHTGILTYILKNHNDAKNLSSILATLSDVI